MKRGLAYGRDGGETNSHVTAFRLDYSVGAVREPPLRMHGFLSTVERIPPSSVGICSQRRILPLPVL